MKILNKIVCIIAFMSIAYYIIRLGYYGDGITVGLSADSAYYLSEAKALMNGHGLNYMYMHHGNGVFTAWPIGYPISIGLIAKIISINVIIASKIVNIISIAVIIIALYKRNKTVGILSLFNYGFLECSKYTWSETAFFGILLLFCFKLNNIIKDDVKKSEYIELFIYGISAFLFRYIGIVCIIFEIMALGIKKFKNKALIKVIIADTTCCLSYLLIFRQKRYIVFNEKYKDLALNLLDALSKEYINIIGLILAIIIIIYLLKKYKINANNLFIMYGLIYYGVIILYRFTHTFDKFNYRLLMPGTTLILIGVLSYINKLKALIIILAIYNLVICFNCNKVTEINIDKYRNKNISLFLDLNSYETIMAFIEIENPVYRYSSYINDSQTVSSFREFNEILNNNKIELYAPLTDIKKYKYTGNDTLGDNSSNDIEYNKIKNYFVNIESDEEFVRLRKANE